MIRRELIHPTRNVFEIWNIQVETFCQERIARPDNRSEVVVALPHGLVDHSLPLSHARKRVSG